MRGQMSVFMILGLIVVVVAASITLVSRKGIPSEAPGGLDDVSHQARAMVQSCLEESVSQQVLLFGLQGGYIVPRASVESLDIDGFLVPYYVYGGKVVVPDGDMLRDSQLSTAIESGILDCVDDFRGFRFPVDYTPPTVRSTILAGKLMFELSFPLRIGARDDIVLVPPRYVLERESRLGETMQIAGQIARDPDSLAGFVDLSTLQEVSGRGFNVTVFPYDAKRFFYVIADNQGRVYDLPFRYQFAVKVE